MVYGWMLLALLAGLWTGLLLPRLLQKFGRRQENKAVKEAEQAQEQILSEWLYGDEL